VGSPYEAAHYPYLAKPPPAAPFVPQIWLAFSKLSPEPHSARVFFGPSPMKLPLITPSNLPLSPVRSVSTPLAPHTGPFFLLSTCFFSGCTFSFRVLRGAWDCGKLSPPPLQAFLQGFLSRKATSLVLASFFYSSLLAFLTFGQGPPLFFCARPAYLQSSEINPPNGVFHLGTGLPASQKTSTGFLRYPFPEAF